ncbi:Translation elongation factor P Lys34--(R)-beta-lysine ligase [hydrothermal vent metagenome]|uniref:Translation elongation factor P Lys34--(R)-beta-lysine ligase n=1 Tax=hydrothermal vent metagenome TaxID=652676 RepID=A0A3B0XK63_9ZZZZ
MPLMSEHWLPSATIALLKEKARMLQSLRAFFAERNVLEVETPILSIAAITDPQLESFSTCFKQQEYFLQTSPEFYMKRLLAAGSGDIYQIARVFRDDELGRNHHPEFTLLEWYRLGFNHHQLMDEIEALLNVLFSNAPLIVQRLSYQQAFIQYLGIDPLDANVAQLQRCAKKNNHDAPQGMDTGDKDMWLDWLMVDAIASEFDKTGFTFLYDYPASQAALARLDDNDKRVAQRFELFYGELELANGFHELTDAHEQVVRFENENKIRQQRKQKIMPIDNDLIDALKAGLPQCAGVAIGLDRLLMVLTHTQHIHEVVSFTIK